MNWLSPFQYDFMLAAFALSVLVGTVCAVFSCFLVLKGWSLMGDAIAHAVLPGIVIAYVIGARWPRGRSARVCFARSAPALSKQTAA